MSLCMTLNFTAFLIFSFTNAGFINDTCKGLVTSSKLEFDLLSLDKYCFQFVREELSWEEAKRQCEMQQGYLVVANTSEINEFLARSLQLLNWQKNGVYIGLKENASVHGKAVYRWVTGEALTWTNWAPRPTSGKCVTLRKDDEWKWTNASCGAQFYRYTFICQFALATETEGNNSLFAIVTLVAVGVILAIGCLCLLFKANCSCCHRVPVEQAAQSVEQPIVGSASDHTAAASGHITAAGPLSATPTIDTQRFTFPPNYDETTRSAASAVLPTYDELYGDNATNNHEANRLLPDAANRAS